jgi:hypothetical protein
MRAQAAIPARNAPQHEAVARNGSGLPEERGVRCDNQMIRARSAAKPDRGTRSSLHSNVLTCRDGVACGSNLWIVCRLA